MLVVSAMRYILLVQLLLSTPSLAISVTANDTGSYWNPFGYFRKIWNRLFPKKTKQKQTALISGNALVAPVESLKQRSQLPSSADVRVVDKATIGLAEPVGVKIVPQVVAEALPAPSPTSTDQTHLEKLPDATPPTTLIAGVLDAVESPSIANKCSVLQEGETGYTCQEAGAECECKRIGAADVFYSTSINTDPQNVVDSKNRLRNALWCATRTSFSKYIVQWENLACRFKSDASALIPPRLFPTNTDGTVDEVALELLIAKTAELTSECDRMKDQLLEAGLTPDCEHLDIEARDYYEFISFEKFTTVQEVKSQIFRNWCEDNPTVELKGLQVNVQAGDAACFFVLDGTNVEFPVEYHKFPKAIDNLFKHVRAELMRKKGR